MKEEKNILTEFELITEIGWDLSQQFGGLFVEDEKKTKSTHLLAKAIDNSISLLRLIPNSQFYESEEDYIDISSINSLSRNLIELCNIYWYIVDDSTNDLAFELRMDILKYHDFISTKIIFTKIFNDKENKEILEEKINYYKTKIESNSYFKELDRGTKKFILKGKKSTLLTQFEITEKRGIDLEDFKAYYKLMSVHTHSSPFSITNIVLKSECSESDLFETISLDFLLKYTACFLAGMIKSVTNLWQMQFAKSESENIINEYSNL